MKQYTYFKNIKLTSGDPSILTLKGLCLYPVRYLLKEEKISSFTLFEPFFVSFSLNETNIKTNYKLITKEEEKKPKSVTPSSLPKVEGREYILAPIREGWIYVFNNNKKIWYEYKVNPNGKLHKCEWEEPVKDVREPNDIIVDYIELDKKGIFYLAYSEVQWSQKYLSKLENSEEMRKERMQYLDTGKVVAGENCNDVFSPQDVNIVFNTSPFTLAVGTEHLNKLEGDIFFFGFNDSFGIADQLSFEIFDYFEDIEALIQSIQLGVDPLIIKDAMRNGKDTYSLQKEEISKQTMALHKMAMFLYQICFGDEKSSQKLGKHLDRNRIEKILAVKERKEIRDKILRNKKILIEFLNSKHYLNTLNDYRYNIPERQLIGKERTTSHLVCLGMPADAKDKLLNLPEGNKQEDKDVESVKFLSEVLKEKNELGKVLAENVTVTFENVNTINSIVQTWNNILNSFSYLANENTAELPILIRRLNSIKIGEFFSEPFFEELDFKTFYKRMKPIGETKIYPLPDFEKVIGFEKIDGKILEVKQIALSEKVVQSFRPNDKMYWVADKILNSKAWNNFIGVMAYLNLTVTVKEVFKEESNLLIRNKVAFINALSNVLCIYLSSLKLRPFTLSLISNVSRVGGAFLDAVVSTIDAGINFYEGDWDAGLAYGIGGVLSLVTGIGFIVGFPPLGMIVLFSASCCSGIIAQLLEDPPLERYVKNCILRNGIDNKILDKPFENVIDIVKSRDKNTKWGFEKWKDLRVAVADLIQLIFGYKVKSNLEYEWQFEPSDNINQGLGSQVVKLLREGITGRKAQVKRINSEISFGMFMEGESYLEYEVRIYPDGLKNSNYFFTLQKGTGKELEYKKNENGIITTTISVTVPDEIFRKLQDYGDIIILTRLHYNNSFKFPENEGNLPRFLAIKNSTLQTVNVNVSSSPDFSSIVNYLNLFGDNIRIGTLNEVLDEKVWIGRLK